MKAALAALLFTTFISPMVFASKYQSEIEFSHHKIHDDLGTLRVNSVNGIYHFKPLEAGSAPLAEASFVNPGNYVYGSAGQAELIDGSNTLTGNEYGIGVGTVIPNHPIVIGIGYAKLNISGAPLAYQTSDYELDARGYGINVGYYMKRTLRFSIEHSNSKFESQSNGTKTNNDTTSIRVRSLSLGNNSYALEGGISNSSIPSIDAAFRYYFNRSMSFGMGVEFLDNKNSNAEQANFSAEVIKYFWNTLYIGTYYRHLVSEENNSGSYFGQKKSDNNELLIGIGGQF